MKDWNKNNPIANFVRKRRKEAGYTQVELADLTGIGLRFLRELEQGKPSLMMDKVNELLIFFGHNLEPTPISNN
jgi:y4mF family transcriptional regulator